MNQHSRQSFLEKRAKRIGFSHGLPNDLKNDYEDIDRHPKIASHKRKNLNLDGNPF